MTTSQSTPPTSAWRRVTDSLVLLLLVAVAGYVAYTLYARPAPVNELETIGTYLAKAAKHQELGSSYRDADGDLVADAPSDPAKLQKVDEIGFCLVAGDDPTKTQEEWLDFFQALEKATGKKVTYRA